MTKKIYKEKMFFSILTKNLNREISIKNFVTFKKWNGIKDENFNMRFTEKSNFYGVVA